MRIVRPIQPLSRFDRAGIAIVAILGTFVGFFAALPASVGMSVVIATAAAIVNGAICGGLLYVWDRCANSLANGLPRWFPMMLGRR